MLRLLHKEADEVFAEHSQEIRPKDKELLGYLTATRESRSLGAVLREKRKRESVANSVLLCPIARTRATSQSILILVMDRS